MNHTLLAVSMWLFCMSLLARVYVCHRAKLLTYCHLAELKPLRIQGDKFVVREGFLPLFESVRTASVWKMYFNLRCWTKEQFFPELFAEKL